VLAAAVEEIRLAVAEDEESPEDDPFETMRRHREEMRRLMREIEQDQGVMNLDP